jgi:Fur family ferric uptake transcriptional regulator
MKNILIDKKIKITKPRLKILNQLNNYITIKELCDLNKDINKSTIYRILDLFLKENIIKIDIINNEKNYIINTNDHIHFINCIKCNKIEKIDICPLKEKKDFKIVSHNISIEGICKDCQ